MTRLLAIDPGCRESAYVIIDSDRRPVGFDKLPNERLRARILGQQLSGYGDTEPDRVVIEMVASYGMAVGADVFETCVWIGRFAEAVRGNWWPYSEPELIKRHPVKLHHCHSAKAKDSNIRQALVDRFAPGTKNFGKGTKADPGFFYGFSADIWQAMALAVYATDKTEAGEPL